MKSGLARLGALVIGLGAMACGLIPGRLHAHAVKEMTIMARLHADRIDLVITTSQHMATVLLTEPGAEKIEVILNADTFEALRPKLEEHGKRLCTLSDGKDPARLLAPVRIDVVSRSQGEVEFYVTYPPAPLDALRIDAGVLERLEAGYVVGVEVLDTKRLRLGMKALSRGDSSLTIPFAGDTATTAPK